MTIIGIDPGPQESAVVGWRDVAFWDATILENRRVLTFMDCGDTLHWHIVIEQMVGSYTRKEGAYVGASVLDTCVWIGRFIQHWEDQALRGEWTYAPRKTVVAHLCGNAKANDRDVRAAIIDRYGGDPKTAIGTKKTPGPLYGLKKDLWQAAALVEWYRDTQHGG